MLVIGRPGVGKTQLIWTLQGKQRTPQPNIDLREETFTLVTRINGLDHGFQYHVPDIGGDDQFVHIVNSKLSKTRPVGIIFMVDHAEGVTYTFDRTRAEHHMRALYSILGVLTDPTVNRCRVILFLINKMDLWERNCSPEQMQKNFSEHIGRLKNLGFEIIVECVSASNGAYLNKALSEFAIKASH